MKDMSAARIVTLVALSLLATACPAATPDPSSAPAAPTASEPATSPAPATDPAALKILQDLEEAGQSYRTIRANVVYTVRNPVLGEKQIQTGWVAYQNETADTPAKIRIHFDTLRQEDGPEFRQQEDYSFDGQWAMKASHKTRKMYLWQLVPPGERARPLKLGEGPLPPLPFGQKAQEVLKYFSASTRPLKPGEPKDSLYLELKALSDPRKELNYSQLQMWIDPKLQIPVKVIGKERNKNLQTIELKDVTTNEKLPADVFQMSQAGWSVERKRYGED